MATYVIKKATCEEASSVFALEKQCFSDAWSENAILSQIKGECYLTFVAKDEYGKTVGYISGSLFGDESEIFRVATSPENRRQRIGASLVEHFISFTKSLGCSRIFLEVRDSNTPARALYSSFGFIENGRRRGYYRNPKEDAILLLKE